MNTKHLFAAAAIALAPLCYGPPAVAQDGVIATVNGNEITEADVALALENLAPSLQQIPEGERRQAVTDLLVDLELIAGAAEAEGLDQTEGFERRLDFLRMQALRDAYFEQNVQQAVTEEDLRARYEADIAGTAPQQQVRARHILVEDEETARQLIAELNEGASFEALAEEHSIDPGSAPRGGDIGFFGEGQMVPAFEEAAFALDPGEVTDEPVQSQFGWHIIKQEETRDMPVPPFEQVQAQLRQVLVREKVVEMLETLRQEATIERAGGQE